jgi:hypothetical protein
VVFKKRARGVFVMIKDPRGGSGRGQGRKKVESGRAYNYKPSLEADKILQETPAKKKAFIDKAIIYYANFIQNRIEEAGDSMDEYLNVL